jgi:hypothetical protein
MFYRLNEICHYIITAPSDKIVKLTGCENFNTYYFYDSFYIYDGYESEKRVLNYVSGSKSQSFFKNKEVFSQQSSGQIMEIVFKTY